MESPVVFLLSQVSWQLFCTFTFRQSKVSGRVRMTMLFSVLRALAGWHGVHFRKLLWVARLEAGELGGRVHLHSLVGGLPADTIHRGTCFSIMKQWEKIGGGHARCRIVANELEDVRYVLKDVPDGGADSYEFRKFGAATVTLSNSTEQLIASTKCARRGRVKGDADSQATTQRPVENFRSLRGPMGT
jgi:hypothetical protein